MSNTCYVSFNCKVDNDIRRFICRYITNGFFEERRVGIPFTGVTSLDLCASLKSGPGFPMLYIVVFYIQRVDDER